MSFRTASPAASCSARIVLLPVESSDGKLEWKIWILSTKLESFDVRPENESLLQLPGRNWGGMTEIDTDVFIIGGGNALVNHPSPLSFLINDAVALLLSQLGSRPLVSRASWLNEMPVFVITGPSATTA